MNYRIKEGHSVRLSHFDPDDTGHWKDKDEARAATDKLLDSIQHLQLRLYAEQKRSLLIVLQAMDTGGKDGTIRHVFSGVNPQGCRVVSFKAPTPEELSHDFLWRIHKECPGKGMITIFNRSHYEDVLITRVHGWVSDDLAEARFKQIRHFERSLAANGTTVLKFFLYISKDEQRERLQARLDDPEKRWKFSIHDLEERKLWSRYMAVYEDALRETSTDDAPWYVVPSNKKWYRNWVVASAIEKTLRQMDPAFPRPPKGLNVRSITIR